MVTLEQDAQLIQVPIPALATSTDYQSVSSTDVASDIFMSLMYTSINWKGYNESRKN